jgi:hypothetical protein
MMARMSRMIVEAFGRRLYPISYRPHPAKTKRRDPRAMIDVGRIEDQVVNQRLSGAS